MSEKLAAPVISTAAEFETHEAIEMLARRIEANPKNLIQSGERLALQVELAKLDAMRAIGRAKETT